MLSGLAMKDAKILKKKICKNTLKDVYKLCISINYMQDFNCENLVQRFHRIVANLRGASPNADIVDLVCAK